MINRTLLLRGAPHRRLNNLIGGNLYNTQLQTVWPFTRRLHDSRESLASARSTLLRFLEIASHSLEVPPLAFAFDIVCENVSADFE